MDLDEAIIRSIRKYYAGEGFSKYEETSGKKSKYSKSALDEIEAFVRKKVDTKKIVEEAKEEA